MVMIMAAALSLPAMAGWINQEQQNATAQQSAFQSTSTMTPSGSSYSSNPELGEDGSACAPASQAPSRGPRKVGLMPGMPDPSETKDNTPIGDAVLPLMLMAAAGAGIIALRRRKAAVK